MVWSTESQAAPRVTPTQATATSTSSLRTGHRLPVAGSPVAQADYESQAGPGLVDGADLVVDHPGRQDDVAKHVLVEVRRHPAGALRPDHPQPAGRGQAGTQPVEAGQQVVPSRHEEQDDVVRRGTRPAM